MGHAPSWGGATRGWETRERAPANARTTRARARVADSFPEHWATQMLRCRKARSEGRAEKCEI
eukprot:11161194-Lingulodinium_polyedra.AAC.1